MKYASKAVANANPTSVTARGFCNREIINQTIGNVMRLPTIAQINIFFGFLTTKRKISAMRVSEISVMIKANVNERIVSFFEKGVISDMVAVPSLFRSAKYELLKFSLDISLVMYIMS